MEFALSPYSLHVADVAARFTRSRVTPQSRGRFTLAYTFPMNPVVEGRRSSTGFARACHLFGNIIGDAGKG